MIRFFIYLVIFTAHFNYAQAVARIDITRGTTEPISIAINNFSGITPESKAIADEVTQLVEDNLQGSGLFKSVPQESFIEQLGDPQTIPNFQSWRQINAAIVLVGSVHSEQLNKISITYRVWDSFSGKEVVSKSYVAAKNNWRKIAHKISDDIYTSITGEEGYFNTKIAYIIESGPPRKRVKKIAIMDSDGYNSKTLSSGKNLVLTPRISPDASKILYMSYINKKPHVHLLDINTGYDKIIGDFSGMTFAPRFSADGKFSVMSVSSNGNSEIYSINLSNNAKTKLTSGPWIDTSPYYSPDSSKIVFASDRSGKSQLYTMNKDGSNQTRISFGEGSYNTPAWSPRGDFIAFTKLTHGKGFLQKAIL